MENVCFDSILDQIFAPSDCTKLSIYSIHVFVTWSNCLVHIDFPNDSEIWTERNDCGSHAQLRWSLFDGPNEVIQLVLKHNACENAIHVRPLCTACQNRKVWHAKCTRPENVFYLLAVCDDEQRCDTFLKQLIHDVTQLKYEDAIIYHESKPRLKIHSSKNRVLSDAQNKRINKMREDIKESIIQANHTAMKTNLANLLNNNDNDKNNTQQHEDMDEDPLLLEHLLNNNENPSEIMKPTWFWLTTTTCVKTQSKSRNKMLIDRDRILRSEQLKYEDKVGNFIINFDANDILTNYSFNKNTKSAFQCKELAKLADIFLGDEHWNSELLVNSAILLSWLRFANERNCKYVRLALLLNENEDSQDLRLDNVISNGVGNLVLILTHGEDDFVKTYTTSDKSNAVSYADLQLSTNTIRIFKEDFPSILPLGKVSKI